MFDSVSVKQEAKIDRVNITHRFKLTLSMLVEV